MFNNISWASYLSALTIVLTIYYVLILIIYYRNELQHYARKFTSKLNRHLFNEKYFVEQLEVTFNSAFTEGYFDHDLRELGSNIKTVIKTGASRKFPREELVLSLQQQLKKYHGEKNTSLKDNVSNYIIAACEEYCSIHLREEEVSALWIE